MKGTRVSSRRAERDHLPLAPFGSRAMQSHRGGYTLVFFAMIMFALMGLAALVIDIGFARLTQRQMQTAVDSAALEGLRGQGLRPYATRQSDAGTIATWHFDDNLAPTSDNGAFDSGSGQFGAGPSVDFSGGAGEPALVASQWMSVDPDNPVYKPVFLNGTLSLNGFEVAMLRGGTSVPDGDVHSVGPSLPYLFARGSMINRQLIQNGIIVRASGIAERRPATAVGIDLPGVVGAQPFAFRSATWSLLPEDDGNPMTDDSIVLTVNGVDLGSTSAPLRRLGETVALSSTPVAANGFIAIFDTVQGTHRVIGFGLADIIVESPTEIRVTNRCPVGGVVAAENGTALLSMVSPDVLVLPESEQTELFVKNRQLEDVVFAPVSVR